MTIGSNCMMNTGFVAGIMIPAILIVWQSFNKTSAMQVRQRSL